MYYINVRIIKEQMKLIKNKEKRDQKKNIKKNKHRESGNIFQVFMQHVQTQFKWKIMSLLKEVEISPGPRYKIQYAMALWLYEQGKKVESRSSEHNTV